MSFHVGQHVVCIWDAWGRSHPKLAGVVWPVKGQVYTVREIRLIESREVTGLALWFMEISNPVVKFKNVAEPMEVGFAARRFRPLNESRLDIFRAHLAPSPKQKERT